MLDEKGLELVNSIHVHLIKQDQDGTVSVARLNPGKEKLSLTYHLLVK
jgi:hypothetical protein